MTRFGKTIGIGAGVSLGCLGLSSVMMAKGVKAPRFVELFNKWLGLSKGSFGKLSDPSAVAFWVIPTYSGLLAGARDKYEMKELALRFGAFNFAFFIFPNLVRGATENILKNTKPTKFFGPPKNLAYGFKFLLKL